MKQYQFLRFKPPGLRLWHWLNAMALLGSLTTVLLRDTFFEIRPNTNFIMQKISAAGGSVSEPVARQVAMGLRSQMWQWHFYFGFALGGLLLFRLLVRIFAEKGKFLSQFLTAWRMTEVVQSDRRRALHYNLVRTGYAAFYLVLATQVATGLSMYFRKALGLRRNFLGPIHEVHELMLWFFVAFIVIHVVGVVVEELKGEKGIVSHMIHGGDRPISR